MLEPVASKATLRQQKTEENASKAAQPTLEGPNVPMPVHIQAINQDKPLEVTEPPKKHTRGILYDPFQKVFISKQIDN